MKLIKLEHVGTDQHWRDETSIYWFDVEYFDYDDEVCYEQLGLSDTSGDQNVVDSDNVPLAEGDHKEVYFRHWLIDAINKLGE